MGRMANIGDLKVGDLVRMTAEYPHMRSECGLGMVITATSSDRYVKVHWFGGGTREELNFQSHCSVEELEIQGEE